MRIGKHVISTGVVVAAAGLAVAGCAKSTAATSEEPPAVVQQVPAGEIPTVTLQQEAADRIGLKTDVVKDETVDGLQRKVVPYAAILYDPKGDTYAYEASEPLVFKRVKLVVDTITGDRAVLSDGPPTGTNVVVVGAAELFGTESEIAE